MRQEARMKNAEGREEQRRRNSVLLAKVAVTGFKRKGTDDERS